MAGRRSQNVPPKKRKAGKPFGGVVTGSRGAVGARTKKAIADLEADERRGQKRRR